MPDSARCSVCGEQLSMPYTCNHCQQPHCSSHRLPENHSCPSTIQNSSDNSGGQWFNSPSAHDNRRWVRKEHTSSWFGKLTSKMRYWKQFSIALIFAVSVAYGTYTIQENELLISGIAGAVTYYGIRFLFTWVIRTRYWYRRNGQKARSCGDCGGYVSRLEGDWVLTCRRCGRRTGWPVLRWVTHSVPAVQFRRTLWNPKLGLGLTAGRSTFRGRIRGTVRAVFSREFLILVCLLVGVGVAGGLYTGVLDDEQVPGIDREDVFGESFDAHEVEQHIHEEVNEVRSAEGLQTLSESSGLDGVAREHSRDMAHRDFHAHVNPDGEDPMARITQSSVSCQAVGENIAQTYWKERVDTADGTERFSTNEELAEGLVEQWLNSPPHKENMLDGEWTTMGVGAYVTDDNEVYATKKFCS